MYGGGDLRSCDALAGWTAPTRISQAHLRSLFVSAAPTTVSAITFSADTVRVLLA